VLLDACVPKRLARELPGHEVRHASEMGWADLDDGPLLEVMTDKFEAFVTVDRNLPNQQRLDHRPFAVVLLRAKTNRLTDLVPLVPKLRATLKRLISGQLFELAG
jgi:predicted nuclease of predicted toxin-antitoxin system